MDQERERERERDDDRLPCSAWPVQRTDSKLEASHLATNPLGPSFRYSLEDKVSNILHRNIIKAL